MARGDQPAFLANPAFWNFVADQQTDSVVRRLHEQVGTTPEAQAPARTDRRAVVRTA